MLTTYTNQKTETSRVDKNMTQLHTIQGNTLESKDIGKLNIKGRNKIYQKILIIKKQKWLN